MNLINSPSVIIHLNPRDNVGVASKAVPEGIPIDKKARLLKKILMRDIKLRSLISKMVRPYLNMAS